MFYDSKWLAMTRRGLAIALAVNAIFLVIPIATAHMAGFSDADLKDAAHDIHHGSGLLVMVSIGSGVLGLLVAGLMAKGTPDAWLRLGLLAESIALVVAVAVVIHRHLRLIEAIARVTGYQYRGFP